MEKIKIITASAFTINDYSFDSDLVDRSINKEIASFVKDVKPKSYRIINMTRENDKSVSYFLVYIAYEVWDLRKG